ncbi:uncharacterized protein LY89DRAFT_729447 [Mollisia scopiformis]|uniref:2EXR domain-containing protein n=1 Tax=Mollisia scopiformis TaxID=149040 RepID=A0A194XQE9_MOLSC|nr:uncharacterized protein LY89DRAFT_729447 [Mollisia scopiformis]KUJ21962.1 hypothetical protein LY89DRAFT_729447 [Mollisia scopiformis]
MDLEAAAAFQRIAVKRGIKISKPPSPLAAPTSPTPAIVELIAFEKKCQEKGIAISEPQTLGLKVKVNEVEAEFKKEIRPIDSESMFSKACVGRGIRIAKPTPILEGEVEVKMDVRAIEPEKMFSKACEGRGSKIAKDTEVIEESEGKKEEAAVGGKATNAAGEQETEVKSSFESACLNTGIRFSSVVEEEKTEDKEEPKSAFEVACYNKGIRIAKSAADAKNTSLTYTGQLSGAKYEEMCKEFEKASIEVLPQLSMGTGFSSTEASIIKPLTKFTVFSGLPYELKAEIWKFSCFPQIIICDDTTTRTRAPSAAKVPVILHVCRQSREEGFKHYKTRIELARGNNKGDRYVYVNYEADLFHTNVDLHPTRLIIGSRQHPATIPVLKLAWSQPIKRFGLCLSKAYNYIRSITAHHALSQPLPILWLLFRVQFASVLEFVVVIDTGYLLEFLLEPNDELVEANYQNMLDKGNEPKETLKMMQRISQSLKDMQVKGEFLNLKLTFKKVIEGSRFRND